MDVQPDLVGLSAATEAGVGTALSSTAAGAAAALVGVTPMGADLDSAQFAAALNAVGAAYLGVSAEHAGQRSALSGGQTISAATYRTTDAIARISVSLGSVL